MSAYLNSARLYLQDAQDSSPDNEAIYSLSLSVQNLIAAVEAIEKSLQSAFDAIRP